MQIIRLQFWLKLGKQFLFYELALLAGFLLALTKTQGSLIAHSLNTILTITISILLMTFVIIQLTNSSTLNSRLTLYLALALAFAATINTQAIFIMSVIFSTAFITECHPLYFKRFSYFIAIKHALDAGALFLLGMYLALQSIGPFPFLVFILCYALIIMFRSIFPKISNANSKRKIIRLGKLFFGFLVLITCLAVYLSAWQVFEK
jgi:hypothetical protein